VESYAIEWLSLLLRWLHLIVGIAWIGASFYFVWLDNSLRPPQDESLRRKGVAGELWAVHGGGFYNPQKYLVAPAFLPEELHWFKWEAYSTWLTGMLLMSVLYYVQAPTWMLDPARATLAPAWAVVIGVACIGVGWLVYDALCRLLVARNALLLGAAYYLFVVGVGWGLMQWLAGRAAFIHVGAMMATAMAGNVFFVIIPGQKKILAQMRRGEAVDPAYGQRAKQRSIHNNYLTLPVLFCMISNHYAVVYAHAYAWAGLALILLAGALIRHFFNQRHRGRPQWRYPLAGAALLAAVAAGFAPAAVPSSVTSAVPSAVASAVPPADASAAPASAGAAVEFGRVQAIVAQRCAACHAEHPRLVAAAPAGVLLDTPERIRALRQRIWVQAVQLRAMPLGNATHITEDERSVLDRWATGGDN
jgi:uncharacterized membrane protein